ncbi:MAG: hypothetical protein PHV78_01250 [Patescibacteria group bacterium]|nr:hypothetical protein [Patescibacteria group bacterium]MDD5121215.1 hypothetical protein [Patescibacteria group bacterium]MDD5221756.1 hypothetical protein [Patescibacteria group bacterium]MDD5395866.1 hypothetical protein [Patescibacteria group bacterium]
MTTTYRTQQRTTPWSSFLVVFLMVMVLSLVVVIAAYLWWAILAALAWLTGSKWFKSKADELRERLSAA